MCVWGSSFLRNMGDLLWLVLYVVCSLSSLCSLLVVKIAEINVVDFWSMWVRIKHSFV